MKLEFYNKVLLANIYFIHGYYKSGLQLTSDSLLACGAKTIECSSHSIKSINPSGKEIDQNDLSPLLSAIQENKSEPLFVLCNVSPQFWQKIELPDHTIHHVVVYRPLEQIVDSITRQRIKDIYLSKKAFGRIIAIRKFQKSLPNLQLSIKSDFITFYKTIIENSVQSTTRLSIIHSIHFMNSIQIFIESVNKFTSSNLSITKLKGHFEEERFIQHKAIELYRDKELMEIHEFFKKD